MKTDSQVLIAYVPVLHQGYLNFIDEFPGADELFVLSEEIIKEFHHLRKDVRRIEPGLIVRALEAMRPKLKVEILTSQSLKMLQKSEEILLMPDEDIMHELAEKYFSKRQIKYISTALRWDKKSSLTEKNVDFDHNMSVFEFDRQVMKKARSQTAKSKDWWRQVGAVIVKDEQVILESYNHHLPDDRQPYIVGDPRFNFHKGDHIEISTAQHAEASLIARAARAGVSLEGCSLYVTTFPCPVCAKLVAETGISKLYYQDGYAMVEGDEILKEAGVELIKVEK